MTAATVPGLDEAPTENARLLSWVREVAELTTPERIVWCDGSDEEWDRVTSQLVEAGTFVNRLKKAAADEENIASALIGGFERTLGVRSADLDPADSGRLNDNIRQQANTSSDVRWIQEDLGHFFARSNKAAFREILDAMAQSRIDLGLEDVRLRMQTNHGYIASAGAKNWAAKLTEWAKKLEGDMKKDQNGQGGQGGADENQDEDFEFMLRVMRMVQQEQDLRARTRALETLRRSYDPATPERP